jgi:cystathionine beta-lyase/cystathionine gamma-synthase
MGAISAALFTLLCAGDHIVASEVCYTGAQKLIGKMLPKFGIEVSMVDTSDADEVKRALRKNTKIIYVETPANPLVLICDIRAIAEIARESGALLIVDSTWSGLVNQRPLELGADVVIHSATKYINGHGDCLCGAIIGPEKLLKKIREDGITHLGACISPFNAWLIMRGSVTLPLRMERHSANAQKVAEFLASHPKVDMIRYPGLKSHPSYELAKKQMKAPSGMINFNLRTDIMEHFAFLDRLKLITHAVSLGHDQSLIYYLPTGFFFEEMAVFNDGQKLKYLGLMGEGIYRLSVGIEDAADIINDLALALEGVNLREEVR